MSYPVIPNTVKKINSIYLKLMSPEEMLEMSYGQVLTSETISYRTGVPQTNGLFCQAIFGPTKDFECLCGKYKRYRYAGVICDKCGVMVAHSSVRRERMGHIDLAVPCVHPWYFRIIPSRIALLLDMKSIDLSRISYFSAYVITQINEDMRQEYLTRIGQESQIRIQQTKASFDKKFDDAGRNYQIDKSSGKFNGDELRAKFDADKEVLKVQQLEMITKIETIAEMAKKELQSLQLKDVISENVHQELSQKFGPTFKAEIGAEAIETLLRQIDLESEYEIVREKMLSAKSHAKKKLSKKMKLIKHFLTNQTSPTWMILRRIMVLPPELRPMLQLDGGRYAASDLNDLYRRLIYRNNRLRKLIQIGAPEVIQRNEKRMLQEAVEALIDNSVRNGKQVMATSGIKRPLRSLTDALRGKQGRFRQNLLGKRVDYSGRSVIIIGPNLQLDQCGLPKEMALELFKPFLIGRIISKSEKGILPDEIQCFNIHSARRLIETKIPLIYDILDEVIKDKYVLLNRAPTLHRLGFLAFRPVLIEGKAIQIHPMVCKGFNADFDGDQMGVHVPITVKGQEEARTLMSANKNLLKPAHGKLIMQGVEDIILGLYYLTLISSIKPDLQRNFGSIKEVLYAYHTGLIKINEEVTLYTKEKNIGKKIITSAGRVIFNNCFPSNIDYINEEINSKKYDKILSEIFHILGQDKLAVIIDEIKRVMFEYVTKSGISISVADLEKPIGKTSIISETQFKVTEIQSRFELGFMTLSEKHNQIVSNWRQSSESIMELTRATINPENNIGLMVTSGSRGNANQVNFMVGIRGLTVTTTGETVELPAVNGYLDGLTPLEYFVTMKGHRKGMAGTALQTADAGYLTRRLVDVAQNIIIMEEDCGTKESIIFTKESSVVLKKSIPDRLYGRFIAKDIIVDGKVIAKEGELVDIPMHKYLSNFDIEYAYARSVAKCDLPRGVCQKCYGIDFSTHRTIKLGSAVGVIAAQSMGEPATQLAVSSVKAGLAAGAKSDVTTGLPRVEELLEARIPKFIAPVSIIDGVVESIEGALDQGFKITVRSKDSMLTLPYNNKDYNLVDTVVDGSSVVMGDMIAVKADGEAVLSSGTGIVEIGLNQITIKQSKVSVEELTVPAGVYLKVKKGDTVYKGQALAEGALELQSILDTNGFDHLLLYIVSELNDVYLGNGIEVDHKHIEIIIKQMCNRAYIIDPGETEFVNGDTVRVSTIKTTNREIIEQGKKPAIYKPVVSGITRTSLSTDSFLSAASFQETARVLVEAALSCKKDFLLGLKESVIVGQLIPCGTGFDNTKIKTLLTEAGEFHELDMVGGTE